MSREPSRLFALMSLKPIYDDAPGCIVLSCLPVDVDSDGNIATDTRFCTLVLVCDTRTIVEVMHDYDDARPYSYQCLTYCWAV